MRFVGNLRTIRVDLNRFRKDLEIELRELIARSAFAWLNAALEPIPIWSGASRSTFADLAARINFQLSVQPDSDAPNRTQLGRQTSTGDLEIDPTVGVAYFRYSTTLRHLIFNEFNANPDSDPNVRAPESIEGTPYGFREKARRAWQEVANEARLPIPRFRVGQILRIS